MTKCQPFDIEYNWNTMRLDEITQLYILAQAWARMGNEQELD
jgi:hypothetical protein